MATPQLTEMEEELKQRSEVLEKSTPFRDFWRKFKKQRLALISGIFILLLVIIAILGPSITPYSSDEPDYTSVLEGPSLQHLAGTDAYGV